VTESFSPAVVDLLRRAGWQEGRIVANALLAPGQFALFPRAQEVLAEFGGLHVGECGSGIDCATSDVQIDPRLCVHLAAELKSLEEALKTRLYPLGEVHRGHGYLILDELGRTYLLSDELEPFTATFARCLELLLLGKKASQEEIQRAWQKH
jgi:hypothetical protein